MTYLVLINKPRGEAHAAAFTDEQMQADGFWQDVGECDGADYPTMEAAEQVASEWLDFFDAQRPA